MSILVRFTPENMTSEMYDEGTRRLEEAGLWPPEGMLAHVCFGSDPNLRVSEVWNSQEQMEAFGERLMPILTQVGVELSQQPEILPVKNVVTP